MVLLINEAFKIAINPLFTFRAVAEFLYRAGSNTLIPILVDEIFEHKGWIGRLLRFLASAFMKIVVSYR